MAKNALIDLLCRTMRELRAANGANVTVTFALATIPMVGFVGAAVDYSHANSVKAAMQAAVDSTALMVSKDAASITNAALQTKANDYFKALFTRPEATGVTVTATYNANTGTGSQVIVNASSNVKANFMGLMGVSQMKVGVDAQVKWGNSKMRVALVLDTTGSMADDGKIDALKTATKSLLTQLETAATSNGDVYVSIIPFSKDVNVGKANYNASWIDWTAWDAANGGGSSGSGNGNWGNGIFGIGNSGNGNWGNSSSGNGNSGNGNSGGSGATNHSSWNGCVTDRGNSSGPAGGNYDTNVTAPSTSNIATLFVAEQYSNCSPKVMPLSYDWVGMKNLVDSFYPNGNTNQGIGIAHGWLSLVGGGPYPAPPPEDPKYKYTKAIILMSDGLNTANRWYTNEGQIDAREALTCSNAKAAGVVIYTVQVNTGGDAQSVVMKNCASGPDKFTEIKTASQLLTVFNSIGTSLSNLRIAQ